MEHPVRLAEVVDEGVMLSAIPWNLRGSLTPVLLVHGLASNARLWDGVASVLSELGHPVVAVDQRGHGLSSKPSSGYDFATVTRDLVRLISRLGWDDRPPMVAGQSWGGNVVLDLAAHHPSAVSGVTLVDGGTIELSARFADWPTCAAALAPPPLVGTPFTQIQGWIRSSHSDWPESGIEGTLANMEVLEDGTVRPWLSRENHMQILQHLWEHHPRSLYPMVDVPALLLMAVDPSNTRWMAGKREEVATASASLASSKVEWIEGDHDLHAQHPELVADLIHRATA
jgi:pimeloyl-ACP methyl ester carboxylesterase